MTIATKRPAPQIVIGSCRIGRVIDGDTVEVIVTRRVRVRLADCWAPETKRTKHATEKQLGINAKAAMKRLAPVGAGCTLAIATDGDDDVGDGLTFGRVVGSIWIDSQITLAEQMRLAGYTFATKAELEAFLSAMDSRAAAEKFEEL